MQPLTCYVLLHIQIDIDKEPDTVARNDGGIDGVKEFLAASFVFVLASIVGVAFKVT